MNGPETGMWRGESTEQEDKTMTSTATKSRFDKLVDLVESLTINFDQHLEKDHKQKIMQYDAKLHTDANIRFYLQNIRQFLIKLKDQKEGV